MNIFGVFLLLCLASGAFGADCMADTGDKCLGKSDVGGLSVYMVGGDPCFLYSDKRWCFIDAGGNMRTCTCTTECGCSGDVTPPPTCDNSAVPATASQCTTCTTTNTMCKYCGIGSACNSAVCQYGLTADEQTAVVDKHNEYRATVANGQETTGYNGKSQPAAANMKKLKWSDELAEVAQRWTDQCTSGHDTNRSTANFASVGQNFAMQAASVSVADNDVGSFVKQWYDEVKDFDPADITPFPAFGTGKSNPDEDVGHYTQVVWAETEYVGCGFIHFLDGTWYTKFLICNYAVAGNLLGSTMYIEGTAGSQCSGSSENGLCV